MGLNATGKIIVAFFMLILGVGLLTTIAATTTDLTSGKAIGNESLESTLNVNASDKHDNDINTTQITLAQSAEATADRPINGLRIWWNNKSNVSDPNKYRLLTEGTDYNFTATNATITWDNSSILVQGFNESNNSVANYTYYESDYIRAGWARSVLNTVSGFFALALMLISVGLFYSVGKDAGII